MVQNKIVCQLERICSSVEDVDDEVATDKLSVENGRQFRQRRFK